MPITPSFFFMISCVNCQISITRVLHLGIYADHEIQTPVWNETFEVMCRPQGQTSPYGDMPDIGPTGVAAAKDFFSNEPTAEDMVAYAQEQKMSPEQLASAWAQASGGSFNQGLEAVNQYLAANSGVKLGDGSYVAKKKGGLLGLAAGGMARGGFVVWFSYL